MSKNTQKRLRSKIKIRKRISGTAEKPRLTVYRSNNHIYAQLIDDLSGKTLVAASSLSKDIGAEVEKAENKKAVSKLVGDLLAKKALEQKIDTAVFDRNGYRYQGRVREVAEGARKGGLKF
jgi:large subunit ribosomal protein L18